MPQDPTMTATLANMIVTGCQMHANVFTMMGKGTPEFMVNPDGVDIKLSDGVYTVTITHAEPLPEGDALPRE